MEIDIQPINFHNTMSKALNLVGGGKDSLVSALLLERNGYSVVNCHIAGLNSATSTMELDACMSLYESLQIVEVYGFDKLIEDASRKSHCLGDPPNYNIIPRA